MKWYNIIFPFLLLGCAADPTPLTSPLSSALSSSIPEISHVITNADNHELQILFTEIVRKDDSIIFRDQSFGLKEDAYFYPASTVKLPVALLALEKLASVNNIGLHSGYFAEGDTLESTLARDIEAIFSISDNDAYNRLVEFLGFDSINENFKNWNAGPLRVSQRLGGIPQDPVTRPLIFRVNDSTLATTDPIISKPFVPLELEGITKGTGYYEEGILIEKVFDFSLKNYYPLRSQHNLMKRLFFPGQFSTYPRLPEEYHQFLLDAMKNTPRTAGYDELIYPDGYGKFFLYGDRKDTIPGYLEIYNKAGWAFGTLTDCAYIRDRKNGVEFIISATLLVNDNGIFNDDLYEYEDVGIPFLAALGREIYSSLLKQKQHGKS